MTTMLYKYPGDTDIQGKFFDYTIVEDDAVEQAQADGWFLTTGQAVESHEFISAATAGAMTTEPPASVDSVDKSPVNDLPPTRDELEAKAAELGIQFHHNTGDKKLGEMIEAKLKEQAVA